MTATDRGPVSHKGNKYAKGQTKHDWVAIRRAYVEGVVEDGKLIYPGPSKLSELFGPPRVKISEKVNREGWDTERALRQRGVAAAADVQKASILAAADAMEDEARRRSDVVETRPEEPKPAAEVVYGDSVLPEPKPSEPDQVRRTLDSSAVQLATVTANFDAKAVQIASAAMTVGAKLLMGRDIIDPTDRVTGRQPPTSKEYRDTMEGIKVAHAIGRLALGQTTENQGHSAPDGSAVKTATEVVVKERLTDLADLSKEDRDALRAMLNRRASASESSA